MYPPFCYANEGLAQCDLESVLQREPPPLPTVVSRPTIVIPILATSSSPVCGDDGGAAPRGGHHRSHQRVRYGFAHSAGVVVTGAGGATSTPTTVTVIFAAARGPYDI